MNQLLVSETHDKEPVDKRAKLCDHCVEAGFVAVLGSAHRLHRPRIRGRKRQQVTRTSVVVHPDDDNHLLR